MPETVVVTGASGGIGRASAVAFGARGDTVVLVARGEDGLAGAASEIEKAGGHAVAHAGRCRRSPIRSSPPPTA